MAPTARDPFIAYLLIHATMLRGDQGTPAAAAPLVAHALALELLADVVGGLPADDERILMLVTLAVRRGQFAPGPATDHAITRFAGTSRGMCDAFLSALVRIARDDALGRARDHGVLPPKHPS